jgi:type 1 glutamine amidotransferase
MAFKTMAINRFSACLITGMLTLGRLAAQEPASMLILSGRNNHEWQKTTPVLENIFAGSGFKVAITNRPDTLKYTDYKRFAVVVSNWNTWPDTSARWDSSHEQAFTRYIREGGGALFLHAGGSSFYGWTDYHTIAIGRWGQKTEHGPIGPARVHYTGPAHPLTQGLKDFTINDEIWERTEIVPGATVLGYAKKVNPDGSTDVNEFPAILINRFGQGRSFYTILGHDEKVLSQPDLRLLLIRAARWAGTGGTGL